jgi:hypothetical protein
VQEDSPDSDDLRALRGASYSTVCLEGRSVFSIVAATAHNDPIPAPAFGRIGKLLLLPLGFLMAGPFADFAHCTK